MSRYRDVSEATLEPLWKEGRGRGEGKEYRPMIEVRDVPSRGQSARPMGWHTQREQHFFSRVEQTYFYCLEWAEEVVDIREQYPLLDVTEVKGVLRPSIESTKAIAQRMGFKHPTVPRSRELAIMTSDFLLTCRRGQEVMTVARSVKQAHELAHTRTLQKLEIERVYWQEHGVDWGLVTEHEIPAGLAENVEKLHAAYWFEARTKLVLKQVAACARVLTDLVGREGIPLSDAGLDCDQRLGLSDGTGLAVVWYLIATRQWDVDMTTPIDPACPLVIRHATLRDLAA
jgi:TnsA endonuclease N terminal/TnsA endonuclease C terminal